VRAPHNMSCTQNRALWHSMRARRYRLHVRIQRVDAFATKLRVCAGGRQFFGRLLVLSLGACHRRSVTPVRAVPGCLAARDSRVFGSPISRETKLARNSRRQRSEVAHGSGRIAGQGILSQRAWHHCGHSDASDVSLQRGRDRLRRGRRSDHRSAEHDRRGHARPRDHARRKAAFRRARSSTWICARATVA
jgi:hypothetical protein